MLPVSQPKQGSSHTVIWHYPGVCMAGLDTIIKKKNTLGCPGLDSNQGSTKHKKCYCLTHLFGSDTVLAQIMIIFKR